MASSFVAGGGIQSESISEFDPRTLGGCMLWLDAADSNTLFTDTEATTLAGNGNLVARWNDKANPGKFVRQNTSTVRPSYVIASNSLPVVNFTGVGGNPVQFEFSDTSTPPMPVGTDPATYFIVAKANVYSSSISGNFVISYGTFTTGGDRSIALYGPPNNIARFNAGGPNTDFATGTLPTTIVSAIYSNFTSSLTVNGGTPVIREFQSSNPNTGTNTYTIGNYLAFGSPFYGYVSEIIVFNRALQNDERQQVEGYLAWKWGLVQNLPVTHPYYYAKAPQTAFQPTNFPSCALWLDAADRNSIGALVSEWSDRSGNGLNVTNASTAGQPTYLNNSISFVGSQGLQRGSITSINTNAFTVFVTVLIRSHVNSARIFSLGNTNENSTDANGFSIQLNFSGGGGLFVSRANASGQNGVSIASANVPLNTIHTICVTITSAGGATVFLNGTSRGTFTATSLTLNPSRLGIGTGIAVLPSLNNTFNDGNIYETTFHNSALTTTQRQSMEGYLAWKWGTVSSLPSEHPNKTLRPILTQPTSINGCILWLNGADSASLVVSNVTQWNDKSGNGSNAAQSTIANQPTFSSSAVNFGDVNRFMSFSNLSILRNIPCAGLFSVLNVKSGQTADNRASIFIGSVNDSVNARFVATISQNSGSDPTPPRPGVGGRRQDANGLSITDAAADAWAVNTPFFLFQEANYSARTVNIFKDGTNIATTSGVFSAAGNTSDTNSQTILISSSSPQAAMNNVDVRELILFTGSALTTAQRQQVEGYLAWKWNLQTGLPPAHPFTQANYFFNNTRPFSRYFNPPDIEGCQLWLDGADESTLFSDTAGTNLAVSGGIVARWNDKSGLDNNATNESSSVRYSTTLNSRSVLSFPSTGNVAGNTLTTPSLSRDPVNFSAFYVCRYPSGTPHPIQAINFDLSTATSTAISGAPTVGASTVLDVTSSSGFQIGRYVIISGVTPSAYNQTGTISAIPSSTQLTVELSLNVSPGTYTSGGTITQLTSSHMFGHDGRAINYNIQSVNYEAGTVTRAISSFTYSSPTLASNTFILGCTRQNGVFTLSTNGRTHSIVPSVSTALGNKTTGAYSIFGGLQGLDIAEVIIYNAGLPDAQRQMIEGYLAWKWGIQRATDSTNPRVSSLLTFPAGSTGSPYYNFPPVDVSPMTPALSLYKKAFDPSDLSPTLWLDSADPSTYDISGNRVSAWRSKGSQTANLVPPTASSGAAFSGPLVTRSTTGAGKNLPYMDFSTGGTFQITNATITSFSDTAIAVTATRVLTDGSTIVITPTNTLSINQPITFSSNVITGITSGETYYIRAVHNGSVTANTNFPTNNIRISSISGGNAITGLTAGAISPNMTGTCGAYTCTFTTGLNYTSNITSGTITGGAATLNFVNTGNQLYSTGQQVTISDTSGVSGLNANFTITSATATSITVGSGLSGTISAGLGNITPYVPHGIPNSAPAIVALDSTYSANGSTNLSGTYYGNLTASSNNTFTFLITSATTTLPVSSNMLLGGGRVEYGNIPIQSGNVTGDTTLTLTTTLPHNLSNGSNVTLNFSGPSLPSQYASYGSATINNGSVQTVTGSIAGYILTVPSAPTLANGSYVTGTGVSAGTYIIQNISSTTWLVNILQNLTSRTLTVNSFSVTFGATWSIWPILPPGANVNNNTETLVNVLSGSFLGLNNYGNGAAITPIGAPLYFPADVGLITAGTTLYVQSTNLVWAGATNTALGNCTITGRTLSTTNSVTLTAGMVLSGAGVSLNTYIATGASGQTFTITNSHTISTPVSMNAINVNTGTSAPATSVALGSSSISAAGILTTTNSVVLIPGMIIAGVGVQNGTHITIGGSGTSFTVSNTTVVPSTTITAYSSLQTGSARTGTFTATNLNSSISPLFPTNIRIPYYSQTVRLLSAGSSGLDGVSSANLYCSGVSGSTTSNGTITLSGFGSTTLSAGTVTMSQILNPAIQLTGSTSYTYFLNGSYAVSGVTSRTFEVTIPSQTYFGISYIGNCANFGFTTFMDNSYTIGNPAPYSISNTGCQAFVQFPGNGYCLEVTPLTGIFNTSTTTVLAVMHITSIPIKYGNTGSAPSGNLIGTTTNSANSAGSNTADFAIVAQGVSQSFRPFIRNNNGTGGQLLLGSGEFPPNTPGGYRLISAVFNTQGSAMGDVANNTRQLSAFGWRFDTVSGTFGFRAEYSVSSALSSTMNPTILRIGYDTGNATITANTTTYYDQGLSEILIFNTALTLEQRQLVEGYLTQKYRFNSTLANGSNTVSSTTFIHPYRLNPTTIAGQNTLDLASATSTYAQNLVAWYDAANINSLIPTDSAQTPGSIVDSNSVYSWANLGGSLGTAANLIQSTSLQQPTFKTNITNGLPGIQFVSGNNADITASVSITQRRLSTYSTNNELTIFVVYRHTDISTNSYVLNISNSSNTRVALQRVAWNINQSGSVAGPNSQFTTTFNPANNTPYMNVMRRSGSNMTNRITGNGTQIKNSNSFTNLALTDTFDQICIGHYRTADTGSGNQFIGYVHEVAIFRSALTDQAIQQIEGYLAWKWGLQASLPDNHAYKRLPA